MKRLIPASPDSSDEVFTKTSSWEETHQRVYCDEDFGTIFQAEIRRNVANPEKWDYVVSWTVGETRRSYRGYELPLDEARKAADDAAIELGPSFLDVLSVSNIAIEI